MSELAIVIVSYNTRADLARAVQSLVDAPPRLLHEIVVVDNASSDGSLAMVRERWPGVRTIDAGGNLGFSRANNLGIRSTTGEFVALLNSDTVTPPGAFDRLVDELRRHPEAAIVGPRLVDRSRRVEISTGRMISPLNELGQKLLGALYERRVGWVVRRVEREFGRPRVVDWVSGACLVVRRVDAEAVGLLDERFFLYTEDVDFCAAMRRRGRTVRFTPEVEIQHLRGRSRTHDPGAARTAYRRSHLAFYAKHHPSWHPWLRAYLKVRGQWPGEDGIGPAV